MVQPEVRDQKKDQNGFRSGIYVVKVIFRGYLHYICTPCFPPTILFFLLSPTSKQSMNVPNTCMALEAMNITSISLWSSSA